MNLNSVIFHTSRLDEIRNFYEGLLELPTGTYVKNNETLPDYADSYVNYHLDGAMLCFEQEENRTDMGTIIIKVQDLSSFLERLKRKGIKIIQENQHYFKIKDPEGRSIIFEPQR